MTRGLATLLGIVAAGLCLAAVALRPPPPAPAGAPPTAFSAARAFGDVQAIAQRPHPIGSADGARVRAYVAGRLTALGLETSVRPGPVVNVVGVLPGAAPAEPAIVLMCHYDSVARGPGAADDAAGIAAALEIVRALKAAGPHRRDVMVVVTDGEEAGLVGARQFFGHDPLRTRVGPILNIEARGASGRVVMFETHRDAGGLIALLNDAGALHGASSLMPDLYRRLPNDTDLTVALAAGREGLNFAFFADQAAYHSPDDTPQRLDLGSLQHMGGQVLAAATVLVDAPILPGREPDLVYGDLLGGPVVAYDPRVGLALVVLAAGLVALACVRARGAVGLGELLRGAAAYIAMVVAAGVVLTAAGVVVGSVQSFHGQLRQFPLLLGGYGLLAAGGTLLIVGAAGRSWGPWRAAGPMGLWLGGLCVALVAAAALSLAAPADAFVLAWPVLAAAVAVTTAQARRGLRWSRPAAAAIAVVVLAQVGYWAGLLFALVGVAIPGVLAAMVALAMPVLAPWAAEAMAERRGLAWAGWTTAAGAALLLAAMWRR